MPPHAYEIRWLSPADLIRQATVAAVRFEVVDQRWTSLDRTVYFSLDRESNSARIESKLGTPQFRVLLESSWDLETWRAIEPILANQVVTVAVDSITNRWYRLRYAP